MPNKQEISFEWGFWIPWVIPKTTENVVWQVVDMLKLWERVELEWDNIDWLAGVAQTDVEDLLSVWSDISTRIESALELKWYDINLKAQHDWDSVKLTIQSPYALLEKLKTTHPLYMKYNSLYKKWWGETWCWSVLSFIYRDFSNEYLIKIVHNAPDYWGYQLIRWSSPREITNLLDFPGDKCMQFLNVVSEVFDEKVTPKTSEVSKYSLIEKEAYATKLFKNEILPKMMN